MRSEASQSIAVLFLIFNRPDTTAKSFAAIAKAKPARLYVAADGPRSDREGEYDRCEQARRIATAVDWPCEVKTLFRDHNLGCRKAVSSAIDWFFEQEAEGIILEDDCLAHPDFFKYCAWALESYRNDQDIWHINGNNFAAPLSLYCERQTAFVSLAQAWGWATWANRWKSYQGNPFYLRTDSRHAYKKWNLSILARYSKYDHINTLIKGLDTWDYQWQITILNNHGLVVSAASNLISNLGDGGGATHTHCDKRTRLPIKPYALEDRDIPKIINRSLQAWYEQRMHLKSYWRFAKLLRCKLKSIVTTSLRDFLARLFFAKCAPIVVASTGRSGSTLFFYALAESLVQNKFKLLQKLPFIKRRLTSLSRCYIERISDIHACPSPIKKTHALYITRYANDAKYIFIYGPPLDAAISAHAMSEKDGDIWLDEHLFHLQSSGEAEQLYEKDILRYEDQITSWSRAKCSNVFCIHYSDLWGSEDLISAFLGFKVKLPPRKARSAKTKPNCFNSHLFERLQRVEKELRSASKFGLVD